MISHGVWKDASQKLCLWLLMELRVCLSKSNGAWQCAPMTASTHWFIDDPAGQIGHAGQVFMSAKDIDKGGRIQEVLRCMSWRRSVSYHVGSVKLAARTSIYDHVAASLSFVSFLQDVPVHSRQLAILLCSFSACWCVWCDGHWNNRWNSNTDRNREKRQISIVSCDPHCIQK